MKSVLKLAFILGALGIVFCRKEAEVAAPSLKDTPEPRELVLIRDEPYMEKPYVRTIDVSGWEEGEDAVIIYGGSIDWICIIPYPWNGEDTIMYSYTNDHLLVRVDPQDTTIYFYCDYFGDSRLQKNYLVDTIRLQNMPYFQGKVVGLSTSRSEKLKIETPEDIVCISAGNIICFDSLKQYPNLTTVGIFYSRTFCSINFWNLVYRAKLHRNFRKIPEDIDLYVGYSPMCNCDARMLTHRKNLKGLDASAGSSSNRILEYIGRMKNLRQLELWYTSTRDDELRHLVNLKNLHTLTLKYVKITDQGLAHLGRIRSLRSLRLEDFQAYSLDDFLVIFFNMLYSYSEKHNLKYFIYYLILAGSYDLISCLTPQTTADGWRHLAELPYLQELDLVGRYSCIPEITDDDLRGIGQITSLRRLRVRGDYITDEGLGYLCNLKNLVYLYVYAEGSTEEGYKRLKQALPDCEVDWANRPYYNSSGLH